MHFRPRLSRRCAAVARSRSQPSARQPLAPMALPMPRAAFIQADDASVAFQATAGGTVPISVATRHIFTDRHWNVAHLHRGIPLVLPAMPMRRGAFIQLATPTVGATHGFDRLTG